MPGGKGSSKRQVMPNPTDSAAGKSFPLFLVALGVATLWFARNIAASGLGQNSDPGPRVFPVALAVFLIFGAIYEWVKRTAASRPEPTPPRGIPLNIRLRDLLPIFLLPGALVIYLLVMPLAGFLATTFLLAFGMTFWLGSRWWQSGLYALGMILAVYLLFVRVFGVPLPSGRWF